MCLAEAAPQPTREYLARLLSNARRLLHESPDSALTAILAALASAATVRDASMHEAAWSILSGRLEPRHVAALARHYPGLAREILEAVLDPSVEKVAKLLEDSVEVLGLSVV